MYKDSFTMPPRTCYVIALFSCLFPVIVSLVMWFYHPFLVRDRFISAIERGDIKAANALCDAARMRIKIVPGAPGPVIQVRGGDDGPFFSRPLGREEIHEVFAGDFLPKIFWGEIHGQKGSFLFGHFAVVKGKVRFVAD